MKDLKTVIGFTIKEMAKRKSFVISTIIIVLIIIIGFNIPNIIKLFNGDNSSSGTQNKLLVVDSSNLFEGSLDTLNTMDLGYEVQTTKEALTFDDIKQQIDNEQIDEAIIVENNEGTLTSSQVFRSSGVFKDEIDQRGCEL